MANITVNLNSGTIQYYNSNTYRSTGVGGGGSYEVAKAQTEAATTDPGLPNVNSGGTSSSTNKYFGITDSGVVTTTSVTYMYSGFFKGECTKSRTQFISQLKINFTLPTGLTKDSIESATLKFNCETPDWSSGSLQFGAFAPKSSSSSQTNYQRIDDSNAPFTVTNTFNITGGTTSISQDITDTFKRCVETGQGWFTLGRNSTGKAETRIVKITGNITITYTLAQTNCTAPTSISTNASIQKPGGKVTISWSGAKAGTNNAIKGYKIYYTSAASSTAPTTSSTCIDLSSNTSTSYSFSVPSNATRGNYYTFKVLTVGTVSGYNSSISSASANFRINSLPAAPTFTSPSGTSATVTEPLSTSTATNITFSGISAGTDSNSQTRTVYYSLDDGNKIKLTSNSLSLRLTQTTVVHFYTYDGLEYSVAKDFTVNVDSRAPTISSLTTSAASTYTPAISVDDRTAAYKINATADVTHGNRSITYEWQAVYATTASGNSFSTTVTLSSGTLTSDKTQISLSNFDITTKINNLNRSYKIKLVITDSGVSGTVSNTNSTIYYLTACPTVTWYNQFANSDIDPSNKFGSKIRIKLSVSKGSLATDLYYATSSSGTKTSYKSLTATQTSDVTIDSDTKFPRGQTRYFYVKFSLGNACSYSTAKTYTRAGNLAPSSVTLVSDGNTASGKIYPYTDNKITIQFPKSNLSNEIPDNATTFKIKGTTEKSITATAGTATTTSSIYTIDLTTITTKFWADLFNLGNTAPYTNDKKITVLVTITNKFGETFSTRSSEYTLYFKSGFQNAAPTIKVQLWSKKNGTVTYYDIIDYDSNNRYPLKEGQYIRFLISGIKCYTNQKITITVKDSSGLISFNSKTITPTTTDMAKARAKYTTADVTFGATIPQIQSAVTNLTYTVTVTSNGVGLNSSDPNTDDGTIKKFVNVKYSRTYPQIVDFNFTSVTKNNNNFTLGYKITEYGTATSSNGGGTIYLKAFYAYSPTGDPKKTIDDFITITNDNGAAKNGSIVISSAGVNADIVYFGIYYYIKNPIAPATKGDTTTNTVPGYGTTTNGKWNYTKIPQTSFSSSSDTDTANPIYKKALIKYYNETPNLLYGKNFFAMNATSPRNDEHLLLEINPAGYLSGNNSVTRNMIYIGKDSTAGTFEIDDNSGLIIDCGNW